MKAWKETNDKKTVGNSMMKKDGKKVGVKTIEKKEGWKIKKEDIMEW